MLDLLFILFHLELTNALGKIKMQSDLRQYILCMVPSHRLGVEIGPRKRGHVEKRVS